HGALTPDTARAKAKQLLGLVAGGVDPFAQSLSGEGFAATVDRYLDRKRGALKPRSFSETERYLRNHSSPLHSLRLSQIDRRKVAALLGEIETNSGPFARNRARSALSSLFNWCIQEGLLETNPVVGTRKADEGGSRERVLTQADLRKLWRALDDGPFGNIFRLLLLTGQRRNEIGKLQWSEIDFARKIIVLPPARTKNSRLHELPLSAQALAILAGVPVATPPTSCLGCVAIRIGLWGRRSSTQAQALLTTISTIFAERAPRYLASLACNPTTLKQSSITTAGIAQAWRVCTNVRSMSPRCAQPYRSGLIGWSASLCEWRR